MSRRAARNAVTRERIAAAALAQVADGGYASATVTAVAARAGVAAGSVYTHFAGKGELFAEVFRDATGHEIDLVGRIVDQRDRPVAERLAEAVEAWSRRALAAPTLAWALMAEPVDPAVEAERLRSKRAYQNAFAALLREGVDRGELPVSDPPVAAAAIVGAMQEALIGPLAEHTAGHDALVASLMQFVLSAVGATTKEHANGDRRHPHHARHA